MAFPEYGEYDGVGLAALVRSGQVSAREVLDEAIRRAEAVNPALNFLCHKAYDDASGTRVRVAVVTAKVMRSSNVEPSPR